MLAAIGVGSRAGDLRPPDPRGACVWAASSSCRDGLPEQEVFEHLRELAARNTQRRRRAQLPRRRHVRPLRARADRHADGALGVPHALHALPARDLPGRAAGDVRVPDRDLRADRPAGLERLDLRGPLGGRRRRLPGKAAQRPRAPRRQRRAAPAHDRRRCAPTPTATTWRSSRCRCATASPTPTPGRRRSTPTPAPRSSPSRTSTAPSRTPRRSAPPPRARPRATAPARRPS